MGVFGEREPCFDDFLFSLCSALYVVDLDRFRRLAAGDRLRGQYQVKGKLIILICLKNVQLLFSKGNSREQGFPFRLYFDSRIPDHLRRHARFSGLEF